MVLGPRPGRLRRPGPGRHRAVRDVLVLREAGDVHGQPEVLAGPLGTRARGRLPELRKQHHLNPALETGQIDYAGNFVTNVAPSYLDVSSTNHTWTSSPPYFADTNVVGLYLNVTVPPLNDPKVRQAIATASTARRCQPMVRPATSPRPALPAA